MVIYKMIPLVIEPAKSNHHPRKVETANCATRLQINIVIKYTKELQISALGNFLPPCPKFLLYKIVALFVHTW